MPILVSGFESPGYSQVVISEFMQFIMLFDRVLNFDLLEELPVLKKAVLATAQYLMPNGYSVSFGDSHYGRLAAGPAATGGDECPEV
jgi:hypothetical protein